MKVGEIWRGRWPGSVCDGDIAIPGARDLLVGECVVGRTAIEQSLGVRYVLVPRDFARRLEPLESWCSAHAERSIGGTAWYWLHRDTWGARKSDVLTMPFIPEYDEASDVLRFIARVERECREAKQLLDEARDRRREAFVEAARRWSRRRVAKAAGLSFARVQQIVRADPNRG